ncbi:hypothetical protein AB8615_11855 [Litorimonas sp. RW-G-Af-16]
MSETRDWILCSSGARASHLRANVKNLALPPGEIVQFRYKASIISDAFIDLIKSSPSSFEGHSAYLTYLDNRKKGEPPKLFPLREACIMSSHKRGSVYIIKLKLGRYFNWSEFEQETVNELLSESAIKPGWNKTGKITKGV